MCDHFFLSITALCFLPSFSGYIVIHSIRHGSITFSLFFGAYHYEFTGPAAIPKNHHQLLKLLVLAGWSGLRVCPSQDTSCCKSGIQHLDFTACCWLVQSNKPWFDSDFGQDAQRPDRARRISFLSRANAQDPSVHLRYFLQQHMLDYACDMQKRTSEQESRESVHLHLSEHLERFHRKRMFESACTVQRKLTESEPREVCAFIFWKACTFAGHRQSLTVPAIYQR